MLRSGYDGWIRSDRTLPPAVALFLCCSRYNEQQNAGYKLMDKHDNYFTHLFNNATHLISHGIFK